MPSRLVQGKHEPECNAQCGFEFVTRWWCPEGERWTDCPSPCPDGRPHDKTTRSQVWVHHLNATSGFQQKENDR